ncbi:MAG: hypothetical protein ACJAUL_002076, partial [Paraglaciecola sp.]
HMLKIMGGTGLHLGLNKFCHFHFKWVHKYIL